MAIGGASVGRNAEGEGPHGPSPPSSPHAAAAISSHAECLGDVDTPPSIEWIGAGLPEIVGRFLDRVLDLRWIAGALFGHQRRGETGNVRCRLAGADETSYSVAELASGENRNACRREASERGLRAERPHPGSDVTPPRPGGGRKSVRRIGVAAGAGDADRRAAEVRVECGQVDVAGKRDRAGRGDADDV